MSENQNCSECGKPVNAGAKFCMHCGASLISVAPPGTMADVSPMIQGMAESAAKEVGAQLGQELAKGVLSSILNKAGKQTQPLKEKASSSQIPSPPKSLDSLVASICDWVVSTGAEAPTFDVDEKEGSASYPFKISSEGGDRQCYLDVLVDPLTYTVYVYSDVQVPDDRVAAVEAWLSSANEDDSPELELVGDQHQLRCSVRVALENASFEPDEVDEVLSVVVARLDEGLVDIQAVLSGVAEQENLTRGEGNMRLTGVIQQWLTEQEWEDEVEFDEEKQKGAVAFNYSMGDFDLKCFMDAYEKLETLKLFMYFIEPKAPEKRMEEVKQFVYLANNDYLGLGQLNLIEKDRVIRYFNAIDVENASFEPAHITNMFNAGVNSMSVLVPKYMAVCFGGKTAAESMSDEG